MNRQQLERWLRQPESPSISIYLPMVRGGAGERQNNLRWRGAVDSVRQALVDRDIAEDQARELLAPFDDTSRDTSFWRGQKDGLFAYRSPSEYVCERVSHTLPERCIVADRPHVSPWISVLQTQGSFHVLALGEKNVQLWEGDRDGVWPCHIPDLPSSMTEVVGEELELRLMQSHGSRGSRRTSPLQFHGHGEGDDDRDSELELFVREIDRVILESSHGAEFPLVIAAAEPLASLFRRLSRNPNLVQAPVQGSISSLSKQELHARAWSKVEPTLLHERDEWLESFQARDSLTVSSDFSTVLHAAEHGQVETLLFSEDARVFGRFDPITGEVETHVQPRPEDEDLVDRAVARALVTSARVFALSESLYKQRVSDGSPIAALLRYRVGSA